MIALCEVPENHGLPEGPVVACINKEKVERIGIIKEKPTAITDSNGRFMLTQVPVGTYLILFHMWPDKITSSGNERYDIILTEGYLDENYQEITASGKPDFWEKGGIIIEGNANWNSQEGFTLIKGQVISNSLGFCFSIRDKRPHPIIKVQSDSIVEITLTTYF